MVPHVLLGLVPGLMVLLVHCTYYYDVPTSTTIIVFRIRIGLMPFMVQDHLWYRHLLVRLLLLLY